MMAAYQPQPGPMPPGMAPHAHPAMTQGQPMNPAQMQMAPPGVVTPGPHVTQPGAMMGMQPGANAMGGPAGMVAQHPGGHMAGMPGQMGGQSLAGVAPNAHALSHMGPAAIQQQQFLQQHLQANPQFAQAQMQQQQQQQQQQQVLLQRRMAALQAGGVVPQGALHNLSPAQMAQLQQSGAAMHPQGVQLPQHMLQQQLQVRAQQQQVAAIQNQQLQQQLAMQQQAQNNAQAAQAQGQGQPANQQQPQHPGQPMRPQSRMANPNEQNSAGTPQPTPNAANAQSAPNAPQQPAQQGQNAQTPGPHPNAPQPGQASAMTQQHLMALHRQRQQMQQQQAAQQQSVFQRQMQQAQQAQQHGQGGVFILKVILLGDHLSSFNADTGKDITLWQSFVDNHFAPDARFMHSFAPSANQEQGRDKRYEVPRATIARYFQTYFDSNASYLRLHLERGRETPVQPNRHQVSFASAILTVAYPNGARLEMKGAFNVLFSGGSDSIELMELYTQTVEESVTRPEIEKVLTNWSPTMSNKASPKMVKKQAPRAQQRAQQNDGLTIDNFPRVVTGKLGITERVQQFLEIDETMNVMADLIALAQERKLRPEQALEAIVAHYDSQGGPAGVPQANPQINLPPNGVGMGSRTPSMQNMQMPNMQGGGGNQFSSPSVSNLGLPMQNGMAGMNGSPHIANHAGLAPGAMNMSNSHTPSPHQSNMAAPAMMPQHSQQGTNSSAASANTSPNVNNKRRRSTVKMEGEEDGPNATRVKPSPRNPKKGKPGS